MRIRLRVLLALHIFVSIIFQMAQVYGIPYLEEWGIYEFNTFTHGITLIYSSADKIDNIRFNPVGDTLVFAKYYGGTDYEYSEICTLNVNEVHLTRLTENEYLDVYPSYSPDGMEIAFLSWRNTTLDIWVMDANGSNQRLLYDSGSHDADIHWFRDLIVFTRDSQIWIMGDDGSNPRQLTYPPRAGEWGDAVLPFGDYDPRINPDGSKIVFERLVDDSSPHGNYDLYLINIDGSGETRISETGWTQGIASWSNNGERLIYLVSAKGTTGAYDIYMIKSDGSEMTDLTSDIFPDGFLAHSVLFSTDDNIYFVGQWYGWKFLKTEITCNAVQRNVEIESTVNVTGTLGPRVDSAIIQLTFVKPDGSLYIDDVPVVDGNYSYEIDTNRAGQWSFEASWMGDPGHMEARSSVTFNVVEQSKSNGGIPGFPLTAILVGIFYILIFKKSE